MEFVTYGKKYIVWSNLLSGPIELSTTAMRSAKIVESGTVNTQSKTVFLRHVKKPWYSTTFWKFPNPTWYVTPLNDACKLKFSRKASRTVLIIGQTVKIANNTSAGARYSHAFH